MFSAKSLAAATAAFSLIASTTALYDANSPANLALYWVCARKTLLLDLADINSRDKEIIKTSWHISVNSHL
jgi:hypothetical protein